MCGAPTEVRDSRLYCTATGADFSVAAHRDLTSIVESGPSDGEPTAVRWGGMPWYCPADGTAMTYAGGVMGCGTCARVLPERLLYVLLESNFHPLPRATE
jgi:hypothetical protein